MSLERRIKQAEELAKQNERGRVLWVIDDIEREVNAACSQKIATPKELHAMKTKQRIMIALCQKIRRAVVAGVEPKDPTER